MRLPIPRPVAALAGFPLGSAAASDFFEPRSPPNPNVLPMRRFIAICPGPRPEFRARIASPALGFGSSKPYAVWISPGFDGSVAIPGRAVNSVVPYASFPLVMSNGAPDWITKNGLSRISQRRLIDPPSVTRFLMSVDDGPYSPA